MSFLKNKSLVYKLSKSVVSLTPIKFHTLLLVDYIELYVIDTTFNNISVISWRSFSLLF